MNFTDLAPGTIPAVLAILAAGIALSLFVGYRLGAQSAAARYYNQSPEARADDAPRQYQKRQLS